MTCLAINGAAFTALSENRDNVQFKMFGDKQCAEVRDSLKLKTGASSKIAAPRGKKEMLLQTDWLRCWAQLGIIYIYHQNEFTVL